MTQTRIHAECSGIPPPPQDIIPPPIPPPVPPDYPYPGQFESRPLTDSSST